MSNYLNSNEPVRPQDIRWNSVKTEEEEYLDKLREPSDLHSSRLPLTLHGPESKLTRVMDGFRLIDDRADPDDMPLREPVNQAQGHDEGLHLMYDYPRPRADDASSAQPFPSSSQPRDVDSSSPSRQRTVRFRSRVRITSGIHSSCGSPSSSISVPLQGPHGPNVSTSTAPLADMLPSTAASAWPSSLSSPRKASGNGRRNDPASPRSPHVDERTPLAPASHPGPRRSYTEHSEDEAEEDEDAELDRLRAAARKSEEQVMFGKWPCRLLNRHVCPPHPLLLAHSPRTPRLVVVVEN